MTPTARLQAAIDILDAVADAAHRGGAAADTLFQRYFHTRRYAGSGDRRAVRELVYATIRSVGELPTSGRAAMIAHVRARDPDLLALFGAGGHGPGALAEGEPEAVVSIAPAWLVPHLAEAFDANRMAGIEALLARAPLDLRVNTLKADRLAVLEDLPGFAPTPFSPWGLRGENIVLDAHPLARSGQIEVQDEGSQLVALACAARPGMLVVDLCAGAGGKTLALAAMMANEGRIVACDTDRGRLSELPRRAARAGVTIAETRLLYAPDEAAQLEDLADRSDVVLVDAPCSGTGTWRRNPEARWRLTPERLAKLESAQNRLLAIAATLVAPTGRLVYAVCSVLPSEGPARIAAFHAAHPGWTAAPLPLAIPPMPLSPHRTDTDGFFIAALTPTC